MSNFIQPPLCMQINILDPFSVPGVPNQYTCTILCTSQPYEGGSQQYTCSDIQVGYWVSNFPSGQAWQIIEITSVNINTNVIEVIIEDIEHYNYSIDPNTGQHGPNDGALGYCWTLAENGLPNLFPIYESVSTTYITDLIGRFNSRNYYNSHVRVFQAGSNFNVGQFLYLNNSNEYDIITAYTPLIYDAIGVITSSGIPDIGHFTYRPFGQY